MSDKSAVKTMFLLCFLDDPDEDHKLKHIGPTINLFFILTSVAGVMTFSLLHAPW